MIGKIVYHNDTKFFKYTPDYIKNIDKNHNDINNNKLVDLYQSKVNFLYESKEYNINKDIYYKFIIDNIQYYDHCLNDKYIIFDEVINYLSSLNLEKKIYMNTTNVKNSEIVYSNYNKEDANEIFYKYLNKNKYDYLEKNESGENQNFFMKIGSYDVIYLSDNDQITDITHINNIVDPLITLNVERYFVQYDKETLDIFLKKYTEEINSNDKAVNIKIILGKHLEKTDMFFAINIGMYNFLISQNIFIQKNSDYKNYIYTYIKSSNYIDKIHAVINKNNSPNLVYNSQSFNKFIEIETKRLSSIIKYNVDEIEFIERLFNEKFGVKIDYTDIHMYAKIRNLFLLPENKAYAKYDDYFKQKQILFYFNNCTDIDPLYDKNKIITDIHHINTINILHEIYSCTNYNNLNKMLINLNKKTI